MALKVSVIIPYNEDRGWLSDAVASAEKQENFQLGKDYEIIVQHGDGLSENINHAVDKCRGEFIKTCAEDDILAPGCLFALYKSAVKNSLDLVCADAFSFHISNGQRKIINRICSTIPSTVSQFAESNTIHGGTTLYRRSSMPKWNERMWTAEEYELHLRMAASGARFGKLDEVVYWYRVHHLQKSNKGGMDGDMLKKRHRFINQDIRLGYLNNAKRININAT